ncbi:MAG: helix-turn-helix domain-containing protein [Acetivibrio ethanolgignens]
MKWGEGMLQRLRDFREDRDISQKRMAEILKVGQTTYSDYELGKINIPLDTLKKLALFFDTSIDYLLELTDVSTPYPRKK